MVATLYRPSVALRYALLSTPQFFCTITLFAKFFARFFTHSLSLPHALSISLTHIHIHTLHPPHHHHPHTHTHTLAKKLLIFLSARLFICRYLNTRCKNSAFWHIRQLRKSLLQKSTEPESTSLKQMKGLKIKPAWKSILNELKLNFLPEELEQ